MLTKSKYWYSVKRSIPSSLHQPLVNLYYQSRKFLYLGNKVHCPVCDKSFSAFVGGHACPNCGSGKRHRLMYLYLKKKTDFFSRKVRVLHFAPENCFYKRFAALPNLEYISGDLDSPRAMIKVDMTDIQFPDGHFDVVISSHVLEHIPDDRKAMRELYRVQNPGGFAIHQAPIDYTRKKTYENPAITSNEERLKHFGHIDHKRIYGTDYRNRLQEAGFQVTADDMVHTFTQEEVTRYGLDKSELLYVCKKDALNGASNEHLENWNVVNFSEKPFV